uniref:Protein phosphatase 2 regulatory subunit Bdelta n=1 Tax=Oryctolagus cuniculus TaxID=9986 RepID=A0A5F9DC80_RABIT
MEELTEVITAAEFHPHQCNVLVYSSSKGTVRLCDMRSSALCDRHAKFFEEPEDPSSRSFFSEIISSISDVKFSHSGRYMMTRDYLAGPWRRTRCTSTCGASSARCTRTTASLTSSSAAGTAPTGEADGAPGHFVRTLAMAPSLGGFNIVPENARSEDRGSDSILCRI